MVKSNVGLNSAAANIIRTHPKENKLTTEISLLCLIVCKRMSHV